MKNYYLAIDIGASSGRHMLGSYKNGEIILEEIYRFSNGLINKENSLCWDINHLFIEIKNGLKKCKEIGKIPSCMAIDTWAVDYVLLDSENQILGKTYGYRDMRTKEIDKTVYKYISLEKLYQRTGIQKQTFNTIYQLMAVKQQEPELLENAHSLLMYPDYFTFLLTGIKTTEYTNATTTQLVSPISKDWDMELIQLLGYPEKIFGQISMPGTQVGNFTAEIKKEIGFDCQVFLTASHDTASAVIAVPAQEKHPLYLSSGTWSLIGTELTQADCSKESLNANLTNEGGYNYHFRYLKNIMGLWMIQSVKKELLENYSFAQIGDMAAKENILSIVDCNDNCFLAPENMIKEIQHYCEKTGQKVPKTIGEIAAVIYNSLAKCYSSAIEEIEKLTNRTYPKIYIVGGGSNAKYLNQITANITSKDVYAGPAEATAIGNILVQMLKNGLFSNLYEARACVKQSFEIEKYSK